MAYRVPSVVTTTGVFFGGGGSRIEYGAQQTVTITLGGLISSATVGRESAFISNAAEQFIDVVIQGFVRIAAGAPANDQSVYVYAWGNTGDANFPDNVTGVDAAITLDNPTQLRRIGLLNTPAAAPTTYRMNGVSLATAFGGIMPSRWGLVVRNFSGLAFTAPNADHAFFFQGLRSQPN